MVESVHEAFEIIKKINLSTEGWESDYRMAGRDALRAIVEQHMRNRVIWYLKEMARLAGGGSLTRSY